MLKYAEAWAWHLGGSSSWETLTKERLVGVVIHTCDPNT